jgi:hypothetical protein
MQITVPASEPAIIIILHLTDRPVESSFDSNAVNQQRRRIMKKLLILLSAAFLVVSLSACAASGPSGDTKVKCPACGHEFNVEENRPYTG